MADSILKTDYDAAKAAVTTLINKLNSDSVKDNLFDIKRNIDELSNCFSGKNVAFAFEELQNQQFNLSKIFEVIDNYSDILIEGKKSYVNQDQNVNSIINSANSRFK